MDENKRPDIDQLDAIDKKRNELTKNWLESDPADQRRRQMGKRPLRISLFDIIIIAIIICCGFAVYFLTGKEVAAQTKKLRYTIELTDLPEGFSEKIEVGDSITDNIKNYHMGTVVDVEAEPYKKLLEDPVNGRKVEAEIPGRETAVITLEADVTESDSELRVNGSYLVRTGLEVAAKGPGYAGNGYILTIER